MRGCEFAFEHWAPAGAAQCDIDRGVAFYTSATFDPGQKPGVHSAGDNAWAGYTDAGDLAVYAAGNNRAAVQRVLSSARKDDRSAR
ncbi:hypothetical protein GCM10011492_00990 [Flexivirga endophytica]|uniref:Uncharacterized protein n=1 Tax=Flexivirga endophytica TaxID=1849103 RepID=A0A916WNF1_9MICO|nr:hypothetical protein [Flexivirga endophytica]GGB15127.1 hypothetical protein GCM10011492_00990 [Flexivirga endophytica]GHB65135.1 hypothetical protein GCM10008112_37500 [Flexivirga endophytica]